MLAVIVATTGAVSASASQFSGLPTWAQDAFTSDN
jgi:hypothetical protein